MDNNNKNKDDVSIEIIPESNNIPESEIYQDVESAEVKYRDDDILSDEGNDICLICLEGNIENNPLYLFECERNEENICRGSILHINCFNEYAKTKSVCLTCHTYNIVNDEQREEQIYNPNNRNNSVILSQIHNRERNNYLCYFCFFLIIFGYMITHLYHYSSEDDIPD